MPGYSPRSSGMYPKRRRSAWPTGDAVPPDRPGVQIGEAEDGPHRGRLARPIGPRKPTTCPAGTEKERSSRAVTGPEATGQPLELEEATHRVRLLTANAATRAAPSTGG